MSNRQIAIRLAWAGGTLASWIIAVWLAAIAMHDSPANGYPAGAGDGYLIAGAFFALLPFLCVIPFVLIRGAEELKQYRAWKATLTPQERFLVDMAEAAALWEAHRVMHERHKREDARLTASVMGWTPSPYEQHRRQQAERNAVRYWNEHGHG